MNKLALCTLFCSLASGILAAPNDGWNEAMTVFENKSIDGQNGFRIPAITSTGNGHLVAVADYRYKNKDWNTDMGTTHENHTPYFIVKTSSDGGNTWERKMIKLPMLKNEETGEMQEAITDASLIHNNQTGTTFLFGYNNTGHIAVSGGNSNFYVFSSNDGGNTWSEARNIKSEIQDQLEKQGIAKDKYENILQGPGSGMMYNGSMYVPIQLFNEGNSWGGDFTSTSGFIYSNDNGKSWKVATLEGVLPPGTTPNKTVSTSESSIFYHKGKVCLAAKVENSADNPKFNNKRVVFSYDNGKWEQLEENFLPSDIAKCETSTLSLSEDVYLVGYTTGKKVENGEERNNTYLTTNTGKKIKILDGPTYGYTSMTSDLDNLYVLFETKQGVADIDMRRFDISAKEYVNVNAQIYKRAHYLNDIQNKLLNNDSYVSAEYGSRNETNIESILALNNFKFGAFYRSKDKNSEKVYRTIEYKSEDATFTLSKDNLLTKDDNLFIGYQYGKIKYKNGSKNDVNSIVAGYGLNHEFANNYGYNMEINGIYSYNHLKRNEAEGLGKSADFKSYSALLKNEFYKNMSFENKINSRVALGLKSMVFGHDKITEKHGNDFNDATVKKSNNFSNEMYANIDVNKDFLLTENLVLNVGASSEYKKELNNVDDWKDKVIILDVEKDYAAPVKKYKDGVVDAKIYTSIKLNEDIEGTISFKMDSTGEKTTTGKLSYKF